MKVLLITYFGYNVPYFLVPWQYVITAVDCIYIYVYIQSTKWERAPYLSHYLFISMEKDTIDILNYSWVSPILPSITIVYFNEGFFKEILLREWKVAMNSSTFFTGVTASRLLHQKQKLVLLPLEHFIFLSNFPFILQYLHKLFFFFFLITNIFSKRKKSSL